MGLDCLFPTKSPRDSRVSIYYYITSSSRLHTIRRSYVRPKLIYRVIAYLTLSVPAGNQESNVKNNSAF